MAAADHLLASLTDVAEAGPNSPDARYRVADLEVFPAGGELALVYARDTGAAAFYRPDVANLLQSCRDFRSLADHVAGYVGTAPPPGRASGLRRELARLSRAGFLIAEDHLRLPVDGGDAPPPISQLVMPTRDRPDSARRAISSYAENAARHGRRIDVVVADDSAAPGTRSTYRDMLRQLEPTCGVTIAYAGADEKRLYAGRLAALGVPEHVARFAVLGRPDPDGTIGANRNVLLLHTLGARIISADDDTVARVAAPPEQGPGPALDSRGDPLQVWFFGRREDAFAAVREVDHDLVGLHERYLGAEPGTILGRDGSPSFERADPRLLRRVRSGGGRVRVTATGSVGDCGWDNRNYKLFLEGPSFARLTGSVADYEWRTATRDLVQSVTRVTVTGQPDPKFAMCMGLDNTELLPPFPPVGRAEELIFASMLTLCSGLSYGCLLPWVVRHDPPGRRRFAEAGTLVHGLSTWFSIALGQFDPGPAATPATALPGFGARLSEIAQLPARRFDELNRLAMWSTVSAVAADVEERLAGPGPKPDHWVRDMQRHLARLRSHAVTPAADWYPAPGGRDGLQRLLASFGELLSWWPGIVDAARQLQDAEHGPARPLTELDRRPGR